LLLGDHFSKQHLNTSMSEMLVDVSMGSCTDGNFELPT